MEINRYYVISKLQTIWDRICNNNAIVLPTQYYDYYERLFYMFYLNHRSLKQRIVFYHFKDCNKECIITLVENKKKKELSGISNYKLLDYEDVVSNTSDSEFLISCLASLNSIYPNYNVTIKNANEEGLLYKILKKFAIQQEPCYYISLPPTYEEYFNSLSKHQRQNIRTAYNRLNKESFVFEIKLFDKKKPMTSSLWKFCQSLSEKRHKKLSSNPVRNWINRQTRTYYSILQHLNNRNTFVMYNKAMPIAYMVGILDNSKYGCFVPRFCINEDFKKYSVGIILVNEVVKYLINNGFKRLDLLRGDEPYKIAMGGTLNYNYEIVFNTKDLIV